MSKSAIRAVVFCIGLILIAIGMYVYLERANQTLDHESESRVSRRLETSAQQNDNEDEEIYGEEERTLGTFINPRGTCLQDRIVPPKGYSRNKESRTSFATFLREYPVKEDKSPVLLFDGKEKGNQHVHVAILDIDMQGNQMFQSSQCIVFLNFEYAWELGEYENMAVRLPNQLLLSYTDWKDGYRLVTDHEKTEISKIKTRDETYETFREYLNTLFLYRGVSSLESECVSIQPNQLEIGDLLIQGTDQEHCIMVIDMVQNDKGEKAYLLGQGFNPAQEFHIIRNPAHDNDPWYYESEIVFPFHTPQWTFQEGTLKRWDRTKIGSEFVE